MLTFSYSNSRPLYCFFLLHIFLFLTGCAQGYGARSARPIEVKPSQSAGARAALRERTSQLEKVVEAPQVVVPAIVLRDSLGVRKAFREYLGKYRPFVEDALSRSDLYLPKMEGVFRRQGLPPELVYLAIIESRLRPAARSRRGAVGLWQFMRPTARAYGLTVGLFRDERKDPRKSTLAAAKYLAYLHDRFDDWFLAIAAYNSGPTRMSRVVREYGTRDFFELADQGALKRETRELVEKFIALTMIMKNLEVYGFRE